MKEKFNIGLFQHFRKCDWDDCEMCERFRDSPSFKMRYGTSYKDGFE